METVVPAPPVPNWQPGFQLSKARPDPLDLVQLGELIGMSEGIPSITIGLIDGPVVLGHPDLMVDNLREIPGKSELRCSDVRSEACIHGTFVAGVLSAKRGSASTGNLSGMYTSRKADFWREKLIEQADAQCHCS